MTISFTVNDPVAHFSYTINVPIRDAEKEHVLRFVQLLQEEGTLLEVKIE